MSVRYHIVPLSSQAKKVTFESIFSHNIFSSLKHHLVGFVTLRQGEFSIQVLLQHRHSLHSLEQGSIHLLLVRLTRLTHNRRLGSIIGKEFVLALLPTGGSTGKVRIINSTHINSTHIHRGSCSNDISLVHPAERNSVDFVRARYEEEARFQGLEAHDALSAETAGQEDEDCAGGDGGSHFGGVLLGLAGGEWSLYVVGGVEAGGLSRGGGGLGCLLWSCNSQYFKRHLGRVQINVGAGERREGG
mmetsp:Transcript_35028/g.47038  ORF Transcript_35028/g.47038 Transcript_35028/m.47038 type:complete len:245 (-) Transcript_35028:9-743(-)